MMKKGLLILSLFLTYPLWGQRPSNAEVTHMNILLLNTLDEYSRTCSLSDRDDVRDFLRLFADPEKVCVYNDLLGTVGYQDQVTPNSYTALVNPDNVRTSRLSARGEIITRIRAAGIGGSLCINMSC